jgi:hypothetical protein
MELLQKLMIINPKRAQGYHWVFLSMDPTCPVQVTHKVKYGCGPHGVLEESWLGLSPKMSKDRYSKVTERVHEALSEMLGEVPHIEIRYRTDSEGKNIWINSIMGEKIESARVI